MKVQKREPLKATLRISITVAASGLNDALFVFPQDQGCTHIGRDYMPPLHIVKGIMLNATNQGQLHQRNGIVVTIVTSLVVGRYPTKGYAIIRPNFPKE